MGLCGIDPFISFILIRTDRKLLKENKREGCRPRQNSQLAEYTWPQIRNRRFHYRCPISMHQDQLLPKAYSGTLSRRNLRRLWAI